MNIKKLSIKLFKIAEIIPIKVTTMAPNPTQNCHLENNTIKPGITTNVNNNAPTIVQNIYLY